MAEASDNKEILAAIKATQAPPADFSASPELEKLFEKPRGNLGVFKVHGST